MRHFLDLLDWSSDEVLAILKSAAKMKKAHAAGKNKPVLAGKTLGMIFEKPSLRTRVSFQAGMAQLGGHSIFLTQIEVGAGTRESLPDVARTISQYVDALVLRTFKHETILDYARWATIPVINALSDYNHPCQALGDLLTIQESLDRLQGLKVVFIGDGNNVSRSLAVGCGKVGAKFILAAPKGYGFDKTFLADYEQNVGGELLETQDILPAIRSADVIYTDVWTSMGQEAETEKRKKAFRGYQVTAEMLDAAPKHVKFLHCLPAHRGEEVTNDVMESEASVVFEQAGNRMHIQKALLAWAMID